MPRIIDVDTEAFAPTHQKAYAPQESRVDRELRRMGAGLEVAGKAVPFASMGISALDKYLVTPIQEAMQRGREEEYKGAGAGGELLEGGETPMQKIARERLAEKEKQKPFDTSAWEKEAEEMYDITKMKGAPDLQAQRPDAGLGRGSPAYEMEVSRQRGGLPRKPTTALESATQPTNGRVLIGHPAVEGVTVPPARKPAESEFAGAAAPATETQTAQMAKAAATPGATTAPVAPKTLATATDDELAGVKDRLEKLVQQNPQDPEFARRLKQVELEQRHRGEAMSYEDWAAKARAADTLEEQQRVLELAKKTRMPVEGLEGLLRTGFERAKLKALGTPGEKGLFPEVSRTSEEQRFLYMQRAIAQQLQNQGLDPMIAAKIAEKEAHARLYGQRAEAEGAMLPYKVGRAEEQIHTEHERHQRMQQVREIADKKLPDEIALMKARTANLLSNARKARGGGGGAGRTKDDLLKAVQILQTEDQKTIDNVDGMYRDALRNQGAIQAQAQNDERDAGVAKSNYEDALSSGVGLFGADKAKHDFEVARFKRTADAAEEKAKLSRTQAESARDTIDAIGNQRSGALEAQRQNKAQIEALLQEYTKRRGVEYKPRQPTPAAAPAAPTKPAAKPTKKKSEIDDFFSK